MKLCITAAGKNIDAKTYAEFGRAPWFLIIDTDKGTIIEVVENTDSAQGNATGTTAIQLISDKKIDAVLTGSVDPNINNLFQTTGVSLFEGVSPQNTVQETLTKFKQDSYSQTQTGTSANPPSTQGGGRGRGITGGGRGIGGGGRGRGIAGGGRGMGGGGGQGMVGGSGQGRGLGGRKG